MSLKDHFELLSNYNQWMNSKVYEAAAHLSATDLAKDRGAFFGSILGTLNHIVVGDTVWLKRFAIHPSCLNSLREVADLSIGSGWIGRLSNGYPSYPKVIWISFSATTTPKGFRPRNDIQAWFFISLTIRLTIEAKFLLCYHRRVWISGLLTYWLRFRMKLMYNQASHGDVYSIAASPSFRSRAC